MSLSFSLPPSLPVVILTYRAPDSEPGPGEGGQLEHEVRVHQDGRHGDKRHARRHVGKDLPTLRLSQDHHQQRRHGAGQRGRDQACHRRAGADPSLHAEDDDGPEEEGEEEEEEGAARHSAPRGWRGAGRGIRDPSLTRRG